MISENINRDFFSGKVVLEEEKKREDGKIVVTPKGTLALLAEWLEQSITTTVGSVDDLIKPFKEIRKLRQKPAHTLITDEYSTEYFIFSCIPCPIKIDIPLKIKRVQVI